MRYLRLLLNILFFSLTLTTLSANETIRIEGTILDAQTKETLIGANILLASDFSIGSQTDLDGTFELMVPTKTGTLIISYIGYEDELIDFSESSPILQIMLQPKAAVMETIVVKGEKLTGQVFAVEKIGKLDIYLNPSAQADALKAVQSNPASTTVDETANVSLRGSPASETGVFLNNVPLNDVVRLDQNNGVGQFSIFNTNTIESVNVFASNPPLEFGNATSGVVALYTDDELPKKANSISFNLVGLGLSFSRKIGAKTSVAAFSNWNSPYLLKKVNPKSLVDLEIFQTLDFGTYGVHQIDKNWQLKFFNYAIDESYRFQVRLPTISDAFRQQKKRNLSIINLIQQKDKTRFEWNQGINFSKANYQLGNLDIHNQNFDYFSGINYAWYPSKGSIKLGLNTNIHRLSSKGVVPLLESGLALHHPTIDFGQKEWIMIPEAFLYTKWHLLDNLSIGLGGRFHPKVDDLAEYFSYQTNIAYTVNDQHQFIASIGDYHKFQLPNSEISQDQQLSSRQYSLDYQGTINQWKWSAAIYRKDNVRGSQSNKVHGIESYVAYQGSQLQASMSLASIQSIIEEADMSYPSPYDMSYFFRTTLKYRINSLWDIGCVYWQRQGRYYLPISHSILETSTNIYVPIYALQNEGQRIPDYHRMDLSISRIMKLPFGSAIVYLNVNNLLDTKNIQFYNYNSDYSESFAEYLNRRTIFFGLVVNWE